MKREEECWFVRLLPDGSTVLKIRGLEHKVAIHGVEIPQPPPELYIEIITKRLPRLRRPLRCIVRSMRPSGEISAMLLYYGWQDKSGDVWLDLALVLLDEGLVRVAGGKFPELEEYLKHETIAQSQRKGIWETCGIKNERKNQHSS
ncbi:MAG: hypothetical protein J5U17_05410 [Candidatus Methanoperedens sp.]|nr:hypothetical protein [Candidatus Methanoperedens sp.]MCE8427119.1 hypothetical protein [Candidatus Methanoperedens sp.]